MKLTLKLEEAAQLAFGVSFFMQLPFEWWWFLVFLLAPDIGMLGYVISNKVGAFAYNLFHHKGIALGLWILGIYLDHDLLQAIGIIWYSHSAFDRMLGYGLKYERGFKYTHLGEL